MGNSFPGVRVTRKVTRITGGLHWHVMERRGARKARKNRHLGRFRYFLNRLETVRWWSGGLPQSLSKTASRLRFHFLRSKVTRKVTHKIHRLGCLKAPIHAPKFRSRTTTCARPLAVMRHARSAESGASNCHVAGQQKHSFRPLCNTTLGVAIHLVGGHGGHLWISTRNPLLARVSVSPDPTGDRPPRRGTA
jgi:hypothetical protein